MENIKCLEKMNFRRKRTVGLILTYITTFLVIVLFMQFVLPQVIDSLVGLINDIPTDTTQQSYFKRSFINLI